MSGFSVVAKFGRGNDRLALLQLCPASLHVIPSFSPAWVSTLGASDYPTPSVRSVPMVSRLEAASKWFVVLSLRGRVPVLVKGPPFSDDDIAWLKAAEPTGSYYGGPEFALPTLPCNFFGVLSVASVRAKASLRFIMDAVVLEKFPFLHFAAGRSL